MRCERCRGMMFLERFYGDMEFFVGWHCPFCGEITNRVILENRAFHAPAICPHNQGRRGKARVIGTPSIKAASDEVVMAVDSAELAKGYDCSISNASHEKENRGLVKMG